MVATGVFNCATALAPAQTSVTVVRTPTHTLAMIPHRTHHMPLMRMCDIHISHTPKVVDMVNSDHNTPTHDQVDGGCLSTAPQPGLRMDLPHTHSTRTTAHMSPHHCIGMCASQHKHVCRVYMPHMHMFYMHTSHTPPGGGIVHTDPPHTHMPSIADLKMWHHGDWQIW